MLSYDAGSPTAKQFRGTGRRCPMGMHLDITAFARCCGSEFGGFTLLSLHLTEFYSLEFRGWDSGVSGFGI